MSFIGYNASGVTELTSEIASRKNKLLDLLETSLSEIDAAIAECWIGEDATAYREELKNAINTTKNSVTEAFDTLNTQCNNTYEEWVAKQSMN